MTYDGQVEVTTMIRKSETESKELDESNMEATLEADEKTAEADNDAESSSEVVVETDQDVPVTVVEGGDNTLPPQGKTKIHTTATSSKDESTSSGGDGGVAGALIDSLKKAALAAGTGGISELIKELELKLRVQKSESKRKESLLTKENTKNEIRFLGGDTSVDPDDIGGSGFSEWKDTISKNPAAISTILEPITNLVRSVCVCPFEVEITIYMMTSTTTTDTILCGSERIRAVSS